MMDTQAVGNAVTGMLNRIEPSILNEAHSVTFNMVPQTGSVTLSVTGPGGDTSISITPPPVPAPTDAPQV